MKNNDQIYSDLLKGLKALAGSAFPKNCGNCGRVFKTAEQFFKETQNISESVTGLKQSEDDDGTKIVEVFRNCLCGSTLMDFFRDRRDLSEDGIKRRERFGSVLSILVDNGLEKNIARLELIKLLRGEKSEILSKFAHKIKQGGFRDIDK